MKFEPWRRRAPQTWLLLYPQPWRWARLTQGRLVASGNGRPPASPGCRVALIIPGAACSHFQLPAPPGLKREEWPLLLEDRLLQAPQALLCGCVSRQDGLLELVSVERAQLDDWLATCAGWSLDVARCWAAFQLLPASAPGAAIAWRSDPGLTLYKGCSEPGREHWLAWPDALGEALPAPWANLHVEAFEGPWPPRLAELERLPSLFEQRRTRSFNGRLTPGAWRLPAACLALAALWGGLWLSQQWQQLALYQAQVVAAVGPVSSPRQAAPLLKRQRQAEDDRQLRLRQLDALQAQLSSWLGGQAEWRLRAAHFDGQRWALRLNGPGPEGPWQTMAKEAGVALNVAADGADIHLVFDLGADA